VLCTYLAALPPLLSPSCLALLSTCNYILRVLHQGGILIKEDDADGVHGIGLTPTSIFVPSHAWQDMLDPNYACSLASQTTLGTQGYHPTA
jgi:hypothetical protein